MSLKSPLGKSIKYVCMYVCRIRTVDSVQEAVDATDTKIVLSTLLLKHNHKQETGLLKGAYNKPFPLLGTPAKCNNVLGRIGRFEKL